MTSPALALRRGTGRLLHAVLPQEVDQSTALLLPRLGLPLLRLLLLPLLRGEGTRRTSAALALRRGTGRLLGANGRLIPAAEGQGCLLGFPPYMRPFPLP